MGEHEHRPVEQASQNAHDGEESKRSFSTYVRERFTGWDERPPRPDERPSLISGRDMAEFPEYFVTRGGFGGSSANARQIFCTGPLTYVGHDAVQADIAGATRQIPAALLQVARPLALIALYILPAALAVQLLARRQFRRLAESVATGALAVAVTAIVNELLSREPASRLYDAITMARPGTSQVATHVPALDPALAGLVAYATMVGLVGRPAWRNALWIAVGVYSVVHVGVLHTPMLTLLITVIAGRAIGLAVRYVAGSTSERPGALAIASALGGAGLRVTAMRRIRPDVGTQASGSRHYAAAISRQRTLYTRLIDAPQPSAAKA